VTHTIEAVPDGVGGFDVHATRSLVADIADVFAFLTDLENHWRLADRFVEVLELAGPPGARTGGRVRVCGPLGLRRTATIRIDLARPMDEVRGSAELSGGTVARVTWRLRSRNGRTAVTLGATIEKARPLDRLLLRAGGRAWMSARFEGALGSLEDSLASSPPAALEPRPRA